MLDLKNVNIGSLIETRWEEMDIPMERTCSFIGRTEEEVRDMFGSASIDTEVLLRWSKLLGYDFFRFYTQHLILYAPRGSRGKRDSTNKKGSKLPQFRKNIYTKEIIDFIMEMVGNGQKTKKQVMDEYRIPKTTFYKWIIKYGIPKE